MHIYLNIYRYIHIYIHTRPHTHTHTHTHSFNHTQTHTYTYYIILCRPTILKLPRTAMNKLLIEIHISLHSSI